MVNREAVRRKCLGRKESTREELFCTREGGRQLRRGRWVAWVGVSHLARWSGGAGRMQVSTMAGGKGEADTHCALGCRLSQTWECWRGGGMRALRGVLTEQERAANTVDAEEGWREGLMVASHREEYAGGAMCGS